MATSWSRLFTYELPLPPFAVFLLEPLRALRLISALFTQCNAEPRLEGKYVKHNDNGLDTPALILAPLAHLDWRLGLI